MMKKLCGPLLVTLSLSGFLVGVVNSGCERPSKPAPKVKQMSHLRALGQLLQNYAGEHGGTLPSRLEDAIDPSNGSATLLIFVNPATGVQGSWKFHAPNKNLRDLNPREIIVSSPVFKDRGEDKRFQLAADGTAEIAKAP